MLPAALATERGALRALNGAAGFEVASPQSPGWYGQVWMQHYRATRLRDGDGNSPAQSLEDTLIGPLLVERQADVAATVGVLRGTWLSEIRLGEAKFGLSVALPMVEVEQRVRLSARFDGALSQAVRDVVQERLDLIGSRASGKRRGLGDVELMPYMDWQTDTYRYAFGLGLVAPSGEFDALRPVNASAGRFWTLRPLFVYGYASESGISMGLRATYSINGKNRDTGNRSGDYLAADFSVHKMLDDQWAIGLQGYLNWQTTADRCADPALDRCGKVRVLGLGPAVSFIPESGGWFLDAKVVREFGVRNRPEGTTYWLRLNLRLDE